MIPKVGDQYRFYFKYEKTGYEQSSISTWQGDMVDWRRVKEGRAYDIEYNIITEDDEDIEETVYE